MILSYSVNVLEMVEVYILINSYPLFFFISKLVLKQKVNVLEIIGFIISLLTLVYLVFANGILYTALLLLLVGFFMLLLFKKYESVEM